MPSVELLLVIVGLPRGTFYYQLVVQSAEDKYADLKRHIHDIYQKQLKDNGLVQSMSRKGNCLDNAAMESFFGTLKSECFHTKGNCLDNAAMESFFGTLKSECFHTCKYDSVTELEAVLHEYIRYYNNDRIKLKLKGLSPVQYRIQSLKAA
ncbi:transposase [Neisseria meningitidis]|nr:transposase [Neisseria meningitidis]